jgi:TM2 domain-containing membrane protein YozV
MEEQTMYCRNCGKEIDPKAAFCVNCGVAAGTGSSFCQNCGKDVAPGAQVCIHCGYALYGQGRPYGNSVYNPAFPMAKSRIAAGVMAILIGALGIHNFYLGYTGRALTQLLITVCTCGVGGIAMEIWALIEGIMILCGSTNVDAAGVPFRD